MRRKCKPPNKRKQKARYILSFTAGIILATFFPFRAIMLVLSVVLIMLALAYCKCP